ncbi:MLN64 N-terminal domain, partial [Eschrichtius robustus]|nr:MLN64 N-terminal domain [Eschrichtius robustus]
MGGSWLTTAVTSAFLLAKVILSKLFSQGAFGYVLPIISFILAWIETWFLDFKVLPQEAEEENRLLIVHDASERAALIPGGLSDGQFYSPPESEAALSSCADCTVFGSDLACFYYWDINLG